MFEERSTRNTEVLEPSLNPEEILAKMEKAAFRYETATKMLVKKIKAHKYATAKTTLAVHAKKHELINNLALRENLELCAMDPKFKPTVDYVNNFIYLEHQLLIDEIDQLNNEIKYSKEEFDMWAKQLSWHQSKMKVAGIEMMTISK